MYQGLRGERGKDGRPGEVVRPQSSINNNDNDNDNDNNKLPSVIFGFCCASFIATKTRSLVEVIHQTRVSVFYHKLFPNREES